MNDVGILRVDLVCCCKICDCFISGIWDEINDMWIWKYDWGCIWMWKYCCETVMIMSLWICIYKHCMCLT